ncbi:breast cancer type 1 susceptibility protein isoform X2 [Rhinatrema bivittatum]|uniref:breast cancer type 1 susceptibility protein isoform X2 n=1 Tax=Rhinatrema bivittatum TaxID=194408 RepID=UPI00112C7E94|nr:breast cancer type 1 susceptibility protein isoform X2 [Rhinatrema bivittatum]
MVFPTLEVEEVHNVLSVMQKNLECPICLELMKEPVSTKCDHFFCRFCMLELLSKKKRGSTECPMCKNEVTKRSLKESPRFKLLVEGLLKTIHAFEIDTGFKFSSSQDYSKKQAESSTNEQLIRECDIVQSRGYRNRKKRAQEDGQQKETNSDVLCPGNLASRRSHRSKRQKRGASEPLYIEFGLDSSSEDLLEKAGSIGSCGAEEPSAEPESKELGADLNHDDKERERLSGRPEAKVPLSAKCDFSEKNLDNSRRTPPQAEDIQAFPVTQAEENRRENDSRASDSQVEQCESSVNPSSLQNDAESFIWHVKGASPAPKNQLDKKSKWPNWDRRQQKELGQDAIVCSTGQPMQEGETLKRDIDVLYEKELPPLETPPLPELSQSDMCPVSRKRMKRSLQRVNEWLSKNNEMFMSLDATSELYPEIFPSGEDESDGDSCASNKTELLASPMETSDLHNPDIFLSKPAMISIEDKVFGKTYKREKKLNPSLNVSFLMENRSTDDVATIASNPTKSNLKRKRKKVYDLQPEDFIQKIDKKGEDEVSEIINSCIVQRNPKIKENPKEDAVDGSWPSCERETDGGSDFFPVQESSAGKAETEQEKSNMKIIEPQSNTHDQESNKAKIYNTVPRKKSKSERKHLTQTAQALQLVGEEEFGRGQHSLVDGSSLQIPYNQTELQIDSYPSSEEASKAKVEQRRVRRSRRLQLLAEETSKEAKSSGNLEKGQKVLDNEDLLELRGGHTSGLALVCSESQGHKDVTDCNEYWSDVNQKEKELDIAKKELHFNHENIPMVKNGNVQLKVERISESLQFSPVFHSESQGTDMQNSMSLLQFHTPSIEHPVQTGNNTDPTKEYALVETSNELPSTSMKCFRDNDLENSKSKEPPGTENALQDANPETEDSEVDIQYLLKTFKGAKRMSFILQPCSEHEPVTKTLTSETSRQPNVSNIEKSSEEKQIEPPEFDMFSKSVSGVVTICETADGKNCDASGSEHSTKSTKTTTENSLCNDKDCVPATKNDNFSENHEVSQPSMRKTSIKARNRNRLQKRKMLNNCSILPKTILESSSSNCEGGENLSELIKISDQFLQSADLNLIDDMKPSRETAEAHKAKDRSKLLLLNSQPESMLLYATASYLGPAAVNCSASESKTSQGENKQMLTDGYQRDAIDEDQTAQLTCANSSQHSVAEGFLEYPAVLKNSTVFNSPTASATPDGLLCCSDEVKENCSFVQGKSVVFRESPEEVNLSKLCSSVSSGSQKLAKMCRRQARKLESSEDELSEDEDLPCFQRIFKQTSGTPSHSASQGIPMSEDSRKCQGESLFLVSSNNVTGENEKKLFGSPSREEVPSASPESVCSVNLFSSQSNGSEDFVYGAEEPKVPLAITSGHRCRRSQSKNRMVNRVEAEEVVVKQNEELAVLEDDHGEDQCMEQNLGEGSGYESEASNTGDSSGLSSQSEILTTQQRDAMQSNLKKLEQEMAALEAVLEQQGTQVSKTLGSNLLECRIGNDLGKGTKPDKGEASFSTWDGEQKGQCIPADGGQAAKDDQPHGNSQEANINSCVVFTSRSPTPPSTPSESQLREKKMPEVARCSILLLKELKDNITQEDHSALPERQPDQESSRQCVAGRPTPGSTEERETEDKLNSATAHCRNSHTPSRDALSSTERPPSCQAGEALISPCIPSRKGSTESEQKRPAYCMSPFHSRAGTPSFKSPVVTTKRKLSLVASGLAQSELLLVQKFARKTQSVFSNQITRGTTHVVMKTDADLVCERTLKYFLGIAGRKWVVSYQWIVQCFKEGRILDEHDFEVKGDIVNGRVHGGPRRARQAVDRTLFQDFEICCFGPFTDMSTEHLEWMVELGGALVIKQPYLFTQKPTLAAVVVVQPDASPEKEDYEVIQRQYSATVVTREWVLDSVACYECQKFDTYLISQT